MKLIRQLKMCIDIYYYLMLLTFIVGVVIVIASFFTTNTYDMEILDESIDVGVLNVFEKFFILVSIITVFGVYFSTIRLIKKTVDMLSKGAYFTTHVIKNLKKIGKLFIICAFGFLAVKFVVNMILFSEFLIGISSTFMVFLIIGLFMMFLSEAFSNAKKIKEENDLTV
ncbi:hypothetical protein GCM10022271_04720 [Corallibacter vietnamensis]|uniref:DUF2975 domain-containing protein n=1 Tax=Corallibacter vietnamensis TaxID=904130 RepID=A0ABP7GUD8_9FLAO